MISSKGTKQIQNITVYRGLDLTCPKATTKASPHKALATKLQYKFQHKREKIVKSIKVDRKSLVNEKISQQITPKITRINSNTKIKDKSMDQL